MIQYRTTHHTLSKSQQAVGACQCASGRRSGTGNIALADISSNAALGHTVAVLSSIAGAGLGAAHCCRWLNSIVAGHRVSFAGISNVANSILCAADGSGCSSGISVLWF
jgi:hypothetical protein